MVIADGKLIYCHGVSEVNLDRNISTKEYNNRTFYELFNNPFTDDLGRPALNIPPITFDDRPHNTPDLIPAAISFASKTYFITFTTPSDSPYLLPSDDPNTLHVINMDVPVRGSLHRGYFCRKHNQKRCYKRIRFY